MSTNFDSDSQNFRKIILCIIYIWKGCFLWNTEVCVFTRHSLSTTINLKYFKIWSDFKIPKIRFRITALLNGWACLVNYLVKTNENNISYLVKIHKNNTRGLKLLPFKLLYFISTMSQCQVDCVLFPIFYKL